MASFAESPSGFFIFSHFLYRLFLLFLLTFSCFPPILLNIRIYYNYF
nr:MAG TPA: hypothetical protein [Caudoviricetes sp.]